MESRSQARLKIKNTHLIAEMVSYSYPLYQGLRFMHKVSKEFRDMIPVKIVWNNKERFVQDARRTLKLDIENASQINISESFGTLNALSQPMVLSKLLINNPNLLRNILKVLKHNNHLSVKSLVFSQAMSDLIENLNGFSRKLVEGFIAEMQVSKVVLEKMAGNSHLIEKFLLFECKNLT